MNPVELYSLYRSAYLNGSRDDRHEFIATMRTFDFSKFRLYSDQLVETWLMDQPSGDAKELVSGGSTRGIAEKYNFGPFQALVDMELLQKGNGGQILWLSGTNLERRHVTFTDKFVFQVRYDGSNLNELFYFIDSYYGRTGQRITLCSRPHDFLYLTAHPRFVDWLITNKHKITSLMTTDCEPLFKTDILIRNGIHINDCMIDWQTGLNFKTCRFGKKHFMPMFVIHNSGIINWMNLANKNRYATIDDIEINTLKPEKCKCGMYSLGCRIVHRAEKYFPFRRDIGELVRSHYLNLQFVRTNDILAIFYTTVGPMLACDRDLFDHIFNDYTIEYVQNKLCMTGLKWPPFWDTKIGPVRLVDFKW